MTSHVAELCPRHQLILAPDGRCVLCRRTARSFELTADEGWLSRTLTLLLGVGLLVAAASLLMVQRTQPEPPPVATNAVADVQPLAPKPAAETEEATVAAAKLEPEPEPEATPEPKAQPKWTEVGVDRATFVEARSDVELVMYAAPWCYICDGARTFLQSRGVTLVERDIDLEPDAMDKLTRLNPAGSVPTFQLQGETIVGFNAWDLADRIDEATAAHIIAGR
jgi:glutaredoxin